MHMFVYYCCVFIVSPPFKSPIDPAAAVDYTAAEYDYVVDDPTTTVELPGKQSHSLPQISPIFPYMSCTRHCYCCCYVAYLFNCITCFCRPLMYLFYPMLPIIIIMHYSAVSPAHC